MKVHNTTQARTRSYIGQNIKDYYSLNNINFQAIFFIVFPTNSNNIFSGWLIFAMFRNINAMPYKWLFAQNVEWRFIPTAR
jgi:hypothetical protein